MKHVKHISTVFLIITAILLSGCSKYKLYNMAIDSKRNSAELLVEKVNISIGEIAYLDNATVSQPRSTQETIVMIHGFGANKDNWVLLADKMTKDYHIIAVDLPGHGDSVSDKSLSYTIANQALWLNEFMNALEIKKANIIGNSMGGAICLKFTRLYPDKVLSMALVDSAGLTVTKSELIKRLEKGENPLVASNSEEYKKLIDFVMEKKPYIPGPLVSVMAEQKAARKDLDEKIFNDFRADITMSSTLLSDIHTPTLIIWGDKDRAIHVDNAEEFHQKIQGSRKVILAGIGHLPMVEDPKKTYDAYTQFLSIIK